MRLNVNHSMALINFQFLTKTKLGLTAMFIVVLESRMDMNDQITQEQAINIGRIFS